MPMQSKTLLQFADAPLQPSALDHSALILIDHQCEYLPSGGVPLAGIGAAAEEIRRLLTLARRTGMPVFHVVHHGRPGAALFDPDGEGAKIIEGLEPRPGEEIVVKSLPNAFARTDLQERVRATGRPELIVVGFATHMCVSSTVRAALDLGYRTTVVASATATRDLPDPLQEGRLVPADFVRRAALAALWDRFAIIVPDAARLAPAGESGTASGAS